MNQKWNFRILHSANLKWALLEILLLWGIASIMIMDAAKETAFLGISWLFAFTCSLWVALRLRLPKGNLWHIIGSNLGNGIILSISTGLEGAAMYFLLGPAFGPLPGSTLATLTEPPLLMGISFILLRFLRPILFPWAYLKRLGKKRLIWAITHAQIGLVTKTLILVFVILVFLGLINDFRAGTGLQQMQLSPTVLLTANIANAIIIGSLGAIAISLLTLLLLLPLITIASYGVARQITRRLEALASSASAFRQGNYSARVAVSGEDEIARLQGDFNAMADDLERTMHDLQTERDRVAALLQSRRELVANVSHELRTPVATVRAYLETTRKNWKQASPAAVDHDLEIMEQEIIRLQGLLDDLFTLSQAEVERLTIQIQFGDVGPIVQQCVEAIAPFAWQSGRVSVSAQIPPSLPTAQIDTCRLQQVMVNLLRNAIQHTPPGGIVAVVAAEADTHLQIDVRDTGEGIAPEDLPHIWERFYRGKGIRQAETGSAGLGLSLVKELVEAMGGSVGVESTPGKGSCFTVQLVSSP